jgi:hypothetical protein
VKQQDSKQHTTVNNRFTPLVDLLVCFVPGSYLQPVKFLIVPTGQSRTVSFLASKKKVSFVNTAPTANCPECATGNGTRAYHWKWQPTTFVPHLQDHKLLTLKVVSIEPHLLHAH